MQNRIKERIKLLHYYDDLYNKGIPGISDNKYDKLYFELKKWEEESGIIYPDSPTQSIHYTVLDKLNKVTHEKEPMLSLDKVQDWNEIKDWVKNIESVITLKLDGLSCRITYEDGKLVKAETRGDGVVGEDVTENVKNISSVPISISRKDKIMVEGEVLCKLDDFEEFAEEYKNSRNFASGSLRLLDSRESAKRKLSFYAWNLIVDGLNLKTYEEDLDEMKRLGFQTVPGIKFSEEFYPESGEDFAKKNFIPIDGLVIRYNDNEYVKSLGTTAHHKKGLLSYKFADESVISYLRDIEWNPSRNGRLTPVACFDAVELQGTVVERASLHNLTVMREILGTVPYIGEEIRVKKSKMIIPQIIDADGISFEEYMDSEPGTYNMLSTPSICPVCGGATMIQETPTCEHLVCTNPECQGAFFEQIELFVGKKGLDVKGLSKKTLEKLYHWGWLQNKEDIFKLKNHKEFWIKQPGFGVASVNKILNAIEESKNITLDKFIASLGISLIGTHVSKDIVKIFPTWEEFRQAVKDNYQFCQINGFGYEKQEALLTFDYSEADEIVKYLNIEEKDDTANSQSLEGLTFVITGKLKMGNRTVLQEMIEKNGGKVTGSVSSKTNYLINNDKNSTSSKNKKAKELGISIINEEEFLQLI